MHRPSPVLRLSVLGTLLAGACAGPGATGPADEQLTQTLPELAAEPGTVGTERYVPILRRVFGQAVQHVARAQGQERAQEIAAEAHRRQQALRDALAAGDQERAQRARAELDGFLATVAVRVFGPRVAGHVLDHARRSMAALADRLRAAPAGSDLARVRQGAQIAARHLDAARTAAEARDAASVLLHAAHAADLLAHLHAAL